MNDAATGRSGTAQAMTWILACGSACASSLASCEEWVSTMSAAAAASSSRYRCCRATGSSSGLTAEPQMVQIRHRIQHPGARTMMPDQPGVTERRRAE